MSAAAMRLARGGFAGADRRPSGWARHRGRRDAGSGPARTEGQDRIRARRRRGLAAVIGDPVRHSRSPAIHNAGYEASGLDWVFVALEVPAGRGYDAVRAMPVLGIAGLSVTMPHKADAARACDELSADATALEVVNTVVLRDDGSLLGATPRTAKDSCAAWPMPGSTSTAGEWSCSGPVGRPGLGALRSVGPGAQLTVAARRPRPPRRRRTSPRERPVRGASRRVSGEDYDVVNATPLGMAGERLPIDPPGPVSGPST